MRVIGTVAMSLAVLCVTVMGGSYLRSRRKSEKSCNGVSGKNICGERDDDEVDDVVDLPTVPLPRVQEFFALLNTQMIQTIMSLDAQLAQYKEQLPQAQLMAVIKQHFEQGVEEFQNKYLDQWNITETELEEATIFYADDPAVKAGVAKLKRIHGSLSGEVTQELPQGLTEERMLEAIPIFFEINVQVMKGVIEELKQEGHSTGGNAAAVVRARFMERQELAVEKGLSEFELTADLMLVALDNFKTSVQIMQAWQKGTEFQQMEYQRMGFM